MSNSEELDKIELAITSARIYLQQPTMGISQKTSADMRQSPIVSLLDDATESIKVLRNSL